MFLPARTEDGVVVREVVARLQRARAVLVLTGSGVSAESGLPTFRGAGGLWRHHRVEELASPEGFERDPRLVWTWYNQRIAAHAKALPNAAHSALARLEERISDFTLATQNVDSLHLRAGSADPVELHGNLRHARCSGCGVRRELDAFGLPLDEIEHHCGGRMRPGVVWFGEPLPQEAWERARRAAQRAEVILVVGTSAVVYPAAALATQYARSAYVVEINPEATPISERVDSRLRGAASQELDAIARAVA